MHGHYYISEAQSYLGIAAFVSVSFAIFLIRMMRILGSESPCETSLNRKSTVQKVMAILLWIFAIFSFLFFVNLYLEIGHQINTYTDTYTIEQELRDIAINISLAKAKSYLFSSFAFTGLGAYSFWYRKSNRPIWKKVLRFVYVLLFFTFYYLAIDYRIPGPIRFFPWLIIAFMLLKEYAKKNTGGGSMETPEVETQQSGQKFCKHCGKPIADDGNAFCQHCGGKI